MGSAYGQECRVYDKIKFHRQWYGNVSISLMISSGIKKPNKQPKQMISLCIKQYIFKVVLEDEPRKIMPINYKIKFRSCFYLQELLWSGESVVEDCPISITRVNDALILKGLYCATIYGILESWNMSSTKPTSEEIP